MKFMRFLVLFLIGPFVPILLVLFKKRKSFSIRTWFSDFFVYFMKLIRNSALVYGAILFCFIGACVIIKPLEFKLLGTIDVHLKIFVIAWTLSFIKTDFYSPTFTTIEEIE
ncbi:hypothetical protein ACQKNX_22445 [Lysinibacillus sp. NPDC093712]|uniref:hypothetical protein n=1 Tax=Lysinibacillus sp. NPDC093712 TaxID=3390579 RepID=UPI003CFF8D29